MKARRGIVLFALVTVAFFCGGATLTHAQLSLTSGSNATTTPSVATSITGFQIVGDAASTTPVKLYTTSGTLTMTTTTGLTFDGSSSGSVIYFSGTVANINAALATLKYSRASTGTDTLEVSLVNNGEVFFTTNNHLYKFITGSYNWSAAKTAAEGLSAYGAAGYLATITSDAENTFVSGRLTGDGWIGASDSGTEGTWKWVTGPEANTSFWQGTGGGSTVGGNYAHWASGEPNQAGEEDCAETYVSSGTWNDFPCSATLGYVVEYGTPSALPTVVARNISVVTADVPAITTLSPANAATSVSSTANLVIGFSKSVTAGTGNITIKKSSDDSIFETIDVTGGQVTGGGSSSITINPTGTFADNTQYYVLVPSTAFKDGSNNYFDGISATTTWTFTSGDFTAPSISSVTASSTASATAQVAWTTNELASSKVSYGPTSSYGTTTTISDTSPRVLSHTVSLSRLLACTTYHYAVVSADASSNIATSTDGTFITSGCVASTTPTAATSTNVTTSSGGSTTLTNSNATITVSAPSNFTATTSSVVIQVQAIPQADIVGTVGTPASGVTKVGTIVFDVKAIIDSSTVLDSFDAPVTITYTYTDADIAGLDESSLTLYHYHNSAWIELDSCTVTASTNTISCTTPNFSIFSLYGQPLSTASTRGRSTSIATVFGCKDVTAANYNYFSVSKPSLCVYARTATASAPVTSASIFTRDLKTGSSGTDVRALQQFLNTHGYPVALKGAGSLGNETTTFGALTRDALAKFQAANKIAPTQGYFGPLTRSKIVGIFTVANAR
ncbi:MAG: Ig-like domain-containing protein [Candidatus Pacebacteria bacterium]|nr:Ig-like domain-containing protein [Candidatus Paceibacterota bacterium]